MGGKVGSLDCVTAIFDEQFGSEQLFIMKFLILILIKLTI